MVKLVIIAYRSAQLVRNHWCVVARQDAAVKLELEQDANVARYRARYTPHLPGMLRIEVHAPTNTARL